MNTLQPILLPVTLLFAWFVTSHLELVDAIFLPNPLEVLGSLTRGMLSGVLVEHLVATISRAAAGFVLAILIGVPLGLLVGRSQKLARATQPTIDFFRSIPATALFPLFLFAFGIGDKSKIAIVVYACALIVLVNTAYGAMQIKESRILAARILGASSQDTFWKIIVPESAPGIFAGLRVALSLSLVLIVVTEMFVGTTIGLGFEIMNAQSVYRISDMYAAIVVTGLLGYVANRIVLRFEREWLHWVGR